MQPCENARKTADAPVQVTRAMLKASQLDAPRHASIAWKETHGTGRLQFVSERMSVSLLDLAAVMEVYHVMTAERRWETSEE